MTDDQTMLTRAGDIVTNPPNIPDVNLLTVSGAGFTMCRNQPIAQISDRQPGWPLSN